MHMRDRKSRRHLDFSKPIWKIMDDYSGAYRYSHQVTIDYKGYIVDLKNEDMRPAAEDPVPPTEVGMPFVRDGNPS